MSSRAKKCGVTELKWLKSTYKSIITWVNIMWNVNLHDFVLHCNGNYIAGIWWSPAGNHNDFTHAVRETIKTGNRQYSYWNDVKHVSYRKRKDLIENRRDTVWPLRMKWLASTWFPKYKNVLSMILQPKPVKIPKILDADDHTVLLCLIATSVILSIKNVVEVSQLVLRNVLKLA